MTQTKLENVYYLECPDKENGYRIIDDWTEPVCDFYYYNCSRDKVINFEDSEKNAKLFVCAAEMYNTLVDVLEGKISYEKIVQLLKKARGE